MWIQILKQIYNQRRANAWIWVELVVVMTLLWYAIDLVYNYEYAAHQPKGYDTSCVFDLSIGSKPSQIRSKADNQNKNEDFLHLYNLIKDYPGVEDICYYSGSIPYTSGGMYEGYCSHEDSTRIIHTFKRYISPSYFRVFRLEPLNGGMDEVKWRESEYPMPTFTSKALADSLFQTSGADALGKTFFNPYFAMYAKMETNYYIMGVLPEHKLDDYQRYVPFIYMPSTDKPKAGQNVAIRVHPDHVAGFAERFREDMQQVFDRGIFYLDEIQSYDDMKAAYDMEQGTVNYLNMAYSVVAFFVFTVFLSILSTFWIRTRKRACEIAVRMAMGSSRMGIFGYYFTEGMLLLLTAAVPAAILFLNLWKADLPVHTLTDLTVARYFICFGIALLILVFIIFLGIFIPAYKAMSIQPAEALHDE